MSERELVSRKKIIIINMLFLILHRPSLGKDVRSPYRSVHKQ